MRFEVLLPLPLLLIPLCDAECAFTPHQPIQHEVVVFSNAFELLLTVLSVQARDPFGR